MFDHIFENRNKKLVNILKIADYLGRSLRENIEVFSINDSTQEAIFITESDKIVKGNYDFSQGISLQNIIIEDSDVFLDEEQFDTFVSSKVSNFIQNIYEEDFADADDSFDNILSLWENRAKFFKVRNNLLEKTAKLHERQGIIRSDSYQKLVEVAPLVVEFLAENREAIESIPEVRNSIILSNTISKAFDCPRIEYDNLQEQQSYVVDEGHQKSIYEMICSQELVRKELYETKQNFASIWVNEEKISNLAGCIFDPNEETIEKHLVEAIEQVPYLALASKKELRTVIMNSLELRESSLVSKKDLNSFVSYLFEAKKPVKAMFIRSLNEKYGVNVQNLKEIPSFKSLANTQVVLFECLAKVAPKNSAIKEILKETSKLLRNRDGVECLDVNEDIKVIFTEAGFEGFEPENDIETLNFSDISTYCSNINELVDLLAERRENPESVNENDLPEYDEDAVVDPVEIADERDEEETEEIPEYDEKRTVIDGAEIHNVYPEEDPEALEEDEDEGYPEKGIKGGTKEAEAEAAKRKKSKKPLTSKQKKVMDVEPAPDGDGDIDAKDLAKLRQNEEAPVETEEPEQEEKQKKEKKEVNPEEYMNALKELEDALSNLDISGTEEEEEE
tara:strand:- start:407 stop:2266 length:1860 start_codon:yes stop_codon:yes gene_type:complete